MTNDTPRLNLSPKEEGFCLAIVEGLSQSDAYRKAYKPKRAKAKTIHVEASRLMVQPKIAARIAELMKPVIAKAQMSRQEWLDTMEKCCRFDPRQMFDTMGNPKEITELGENEAVAVVGFEFYEDFGGKGESRKAAGYTKKFRLIDRLRALEILGKARHWYADRQEQLGPDGGPVQKEIVVRLVSPPKSPEEAYQRLIKGTDLPEGPEKTDHRGSSPRKP